MSNASEASSKAQVPWGTTHLVPTETKITGPKDNRDRRGSTWGCCLPSIFLFHVEPCSFDQVSSQPYFFFVSWLVAFSLKCLLRVSGELFHLAPWPFLWPLPKRQPQSLSMVLDLFLRVGLQHEKYQIADRMFGGTRVPGAFRLPRQSRDLITMGPTGLGPACSWL